jgi:hypothetical protein
MKIPHASSIVACIDGYQMTLKGKTGAWPCSPRAFPTFEHIRHFRAPCSSVRQFADKEGERLGVSREP